MKRKLLLVMLAILLVATLCACAEAHTHHYEQTVVQPSCTEQGYTTYTCSCGDSYISDYVSATGHSYNDIVTNPTCTEQGFTTHTCSRCGDTYKDNFVFALQHNYNNVVTNPTCTEQGFTTHTCLRCNNNYKDNFIPALGHNHVNGVCTRCGEKELVVDTSIVAKTLKLDGTQLNGIVSNATTQFNFNNEITVSNGATWHVCADEYGQNEFLSKKVPLYEGDNTFCIFVSNGNEMVTYNVTIRRKPMYTVTFASNYCAVPASQVVEEGTILAEPSKPTKEYLGYKFVDWNFDFTQPITSNVTINAIVENLFPNLNFTSTETTCTITGVKDKSVTEVVIPNYVTSIGNYAFQNCSRLTSIVIPDSVTSIGYSAFSGCSRLTSITLPFVGAKAGVTSSSTYQYPLGYIFGTSSYTDETEVTQYYYGSSTSSTTSKYYYIPSSLKSVTITGGYIPYGAFYNCSMLTDITLGNSVTSIGYNAFYGCNKLTKVNYTGDINGWAQIEFGGSSANPLCYADNLYINDKLVTVANITTATKISEYAFRNCSSLTSITIPNSITTIGDNAFEWCSSLTSIVIPDSVTSIGEYAFRGCSSLESITLPFVGAKAGVTSSSTYQYPLGYIFGTSSYNKKRTSI